MPNETPAILKEIGDIKGKAGNIEGKLDMLIQSQAENNQAMWAAIHKNRDDIAEVKISSAKRAGMVSVLVSTGIALIVAGAKELISG